MALLTSSYQQVQDAVEILRDPERRSLLDAKLNENIKRPRFPEDDYYHSARTYEGRYRHPSKRERRQYDFNWPKYQYRHRYTNFADEFTCYMRSFGISVHMDPNSPESKAKRAQFEADNVQWENEWAGIDPEVQKARAELRKESMRARMKRDVADMMGDQEADPEFVDIIEHVVDEGLDELNFGVGHDFHDFEIHKENFNTCNPADTFNEFAYEYAKASASGEKHGVHSDGASSPCSAASSESTGDFSTNSTSTIDNPCLHHEDSNIESTSNAFKTTAEAFKAATEAFKSATEDATAAVDTMNDSFLVEHESTLPLIPFFNQKLADPCGRYTMDDYGAEINGIMLEIYCGWLEDVRLSVPNTTPATVRNDPKLCSHLGLWYKDFCRPTCEACNFWMPIFILTCPGCGVKACVRCKFAVVAPKH